VRQVEYLTYKRDLDEAMSDKSMQAVKAKGRRVMARPVGSSMVMYHDELWIPSAVLLRARKH
jgi:hypothetical protein